MLSVMIAAVHSGTVTKTQTMHYFLLPLICLYNFMYLITKIVWILFENLTKEFPGHLSSDLMYSFLPTLEC